MQPQTVTPTESKPATGPRERGFSGRRKLSLAFHALAAAAWLAVDLTVGPSSSWAQPGWLALIAVLAVVADRASGVPLPGGVSFDATIALVLLAVVTGGPLPAMVVFAAPWVVTLLTDRPRAIRAGALADCALYGWQALAAALLLHGTLDGAAGATAFALLVGAGVLQFVVGWAVGPAVYGTLWVGRPLRVLSRALVDMAPAAAIMVVLGALTVLLEPQLGIAALVLFAGVAVLPQSALTVAARTQPVARLDPDAAQRRYAHALALQLGLSRHERRHLRTVLSVAQRRPATGEPLGYVAATLAERGLAASDAQLVTEWWDGRGGPLGFAGEQIPLAARVLAVAGTWSTLTARGGPELSHADALTHLQSVAGQRLDPVVVRAARAVIAEEPVSAAMPAPEPRLHQLGLPAPLRRLIAAGAAA